MVVEENGNPMIQANELRIGNWVNHTHWDKRIQARQIEWYDFQHAFNLHDARHEVEWNAIQPIPLDESWLIRAGFIYHNPSDFYSKNWGRNGVEIVKKYPAGWLFELGKGYLRHFEYVHQLQNLFFALTGSELEFKDAANS